MVLKSDPRKNGEVRPQTPDSEAGDVRTRRTFLADAGKKAAFVAPVVLSLTAQPAFAASGESCSAYGAACEVNEDCCDLNCHAPTMTCKGPIGLF